MRRSARTVAAGRAIATALPAGPLVVLWASPAQAHAEHASTGHGPVWVPVLAAVVGGWFLASPSRRRSPVGLLAGVLLLVGPSWPDLLRAGHLAGAGLWAGAVLHVVRRPSRAVLRTAAPTAVGGAALACTTGLVAALRLGIDLRSPYGNLLLLKGVVVGVVVGVALLVLHRPRLVRLEAIVLSAALVLGMLLAVRPLVALPDGVVVTQQSSLFVAYDADGRRLLRVAPATTRIPGLHMVPAPDGSATARL